MQLKMRLPRLPLAFLLLALLLFFLPGLLRSWEQAAAPSPGTGTSAVSVQPFPLCRILLLTHTSLRLVRAGDPPAHNSAKARKLECLLLRAEMDDRLYSRALPDTSLAEHPDTVLQHDTISWLTAAWKHLVGQQPRANNPVSITNL